MTTNRRAVAALAALAASVALAACGSSSPGSAAGGESSSPAASPSGAGIIWHPGGAYTGPFPPPSTLTRCRDRSGP